MSEWAHDRLLSRLERLRLIGKDPQGGITRPFGSAAELEARTWFAEEVRQAGLTLHGDAAANLWARYPGQTDGVLACGSHLDTVPHGGAYDGALGVLMALEAVQTLKESGYQPKHTLAVLALTGEEPNAFRLSTLGSRLLTGVLRLEDLATAADGQGRRVAEALRDAGANADPDDLLEASGLCGFLEPHIEQGPRLQDQGDPLGVVSRITGIVRHAIVLEGEQNHAGTTPWAVRRDSVQAFAGAMALFQEWLGSYPGQLTGTVGFVDVYPNAVNIVPSRVEFIVEWRSPDWELLESVAEGYWEAVQAFCRAEGMGAGRQVVLHQAPSAMDPGVQALLSQTMAQQGLPAPVMVSWAGHDAAHLARRVPAGMLFIRSNGKSHCPDEACAPADILTGVRVLTEFLRQWDAAPVREVGP